MYTRKNYRPLIFAIVLMILAALACNAPGEQDSPPPAITISLPTSTAQQAQEATFTPAPGEPVPTSTSVPDISGPGGCTLNAAYVADVTVPDDTQYEPGATFTKVWRVRNSGTCAWEQGARLIFIADDPLGGPTGVDIPQEIDPEANVDVSVDFVAPSTPGTYRSTWQLQDSDGTRFGSQVYVQIIVPDPATETPTPTEEADPPDLIISELKIDTDDPRQGDPINIIATFQNLGGQVAENFHWSWRVCITDGCEYITSSGYYTLQAGEEIDALMEYTFEGWANYTTEAVVDADHEVDESDETNNTRQLIIPVQAGLPDLVIYDITFDPDPPVQGENTEVRVSIRNQGSKPVDGFDVEWWGGVNFDEPSCEWSVTGTMEQGDTTHMACTFAYTSWYGTITSQAIVDVADEVDESDETNNTLDKETPVNQQ